MYHINPYLTQSVIRYLIFKGIYEIKSEKYLTPKRRMARFFQSKRDESKQASEGKGKKGTVTQSCSGAIKNKYVYIYIYIYIYMYIYIKTVAFPWGVWGDGGDIRPPDPP